MVLNTITVGAAVTPTVIETAVSHYLHRKPLQHKPTAHISYHEGLQLVRQFLHYASLHTVDEVQAFTRQWVPVPHWVRVDQILVPQAKLSHAAAYLQAQLGPAGIEQVGGKTWWQWRQANSPLKADWIEMRKDHNEREETDDKGQRIILYVHGGAYYFGSVDEHRYQMQRHARKLKARLLAPRYRLAPQFPFPCGLCDCLATYLHLVETYDPSTILLAGDSAGGGMVLSMLVILRDQGVPLPAGAILLSPWVDLTHSFPSLGGDGSLDYIPANGFVHKPSRSWPPPNSDDQEKLRQGTLKPQHLADISNSAGSKLPSNRDEKSEGAAQGFAIVPDTESGNSKGPAAHPNGDESRSDAKHMTTSNLTITIDGKRIEIKDQIQMYAPNHLLTHPLVSPVLQPSLGGLPPLLIQVGGGELLRDEQIYLAHKAANPAKYRPSEAYLDLHDPDRSRLSRWKPTDVQLQVWDDLCHVAPTLSWTRPAKFMYRSIAQFGAWALARAQQKPITILDDDDISIISSSSSGSPTESSTEDLKNRTHESIPLPSFAPIAASIAVGKAGDPLPPFENHMVRQRVDRHGNFHPLAPVSELAALQLAPEEIGVIKEGPVRKWLHTQKQWNARFAREKRALQKQRMAEMAKGYVGFGEGENPPPTALAGRRREGEVMKEKRLRRSWGMSMWSGWGSKHDKMTIRREEHPQGPKRTGSRASVSPIQPGKRDRAYSRVRSVVDQGQASASDEQPKATTERVPRVTAPPAITVDSTTRTSHAAEDGESAPTPTIIPPSNTTSTRPIHDNIAYPFKIALSPSEGREINASTVTLTSMLPAGPPELETPVPDALGTQTPKALDADEGVSVRLNKTLGRGPQETQLGYEEGDAAETAAKLERPVVERFDTAREEP